MIMTDNTIIETKTHLQHTKHEYIVLRVIRRSTGEVIATHTAKDWTYINKRVDFYRNNN